MGVDPSADLIYGIPFVYQQHTKTVTRYNETTGQPYPRDVTEYTRVLCLPDGTVATFPETDFDDDVMDEYMNEFEFGQEIGAIGIRLASIDCFSDSFEEIEMGDMDALDSAFTMVCDQFLPDLTEYLSQHARLVLVNTTS